MNDTTQPLDRLLEAVQAGAKYRHIEPEFIRHIGAEELRKRKNLKEAIKSTKNRLHQVGGSYQVDEPRYARWLAELEAAASSGEKGQVQSACRAIMRHHASTSERLPFLETFYTTILAGLPPIHSVIDIACGLHPLALPWMPLVEPISYYACDIYQDMMEFLNLCFPLFGVQGQAGVRDVISDCPTQRADVAFLFKAIPCLEQVDRHIGQRLLEHIQTDYIVVSFPVASLGGRNKGMVAHYGAHFAELLKEKNWPVQRYNFPTELVFVIQK